MPTDPDLDLDHLQAIFVKLGPNVEPAAKAGMMLIARVRELEEFNAQLRERDIELNDLCVETEKERADIVAHAYPLIEDAGLTDGERAVLAVFIGSVKHGEHVGAAKRAENKG